MEFVAPQRYFAWPYSQLASAYDIALGIPNFIGTRAAFERLVRRYDIRFRSAADVGCGTGLFACYLSQCWGVPVFGVDRSPEMLAVATRNCTSSNVCLLEPLVNNSLDLCRHGFTVLQGLNAGGASRTCLLSCRSRSVVDGRRLSNPSCARRHNTSFGYQLPATRYRRSKKAV
jgi:SAM-dependent methyltransferase